jgi:hypothetical protein
MIDKKEEIKLLKECKEILVELIDAARPFTSGDIVDETDGTIPIMERLEVAIERAESIINAPRETKEEH